jgi:shikimate dehydrogenase
MSQFGLIGHPVGHSMSKAMHEAAFRALGLDYSYGLYDVSPDELRLFMENSNFLGLNVTTPLKVRVLEYLDELTEHALLTDAVNTIEFAGGRRIGHNTDVVGFMKSLEEAGVEVSGRNFLVLGTGGASRAIVTKLAFQKARVTVWGRDYAAAKKLAQAVFERVGVMVEAVESFEARVNDVDVLVNATSVGMYPNVDDTIIPARIINPMTTVVDIVYNPVETRLLRQARKRGCETVNGVGMLVHQGVEALRIWLDIEAPADVMRQAVLENLKTRV